MGDREATRSEPSTSTSEFVDDESEFESEDSCSELDLFWELEHSLIITLSNISLD